MLRILARAGAAALREQALEQGYAKLAATNDSDHEERRARRDRYAERVDSRYVE